MTNRLLGVALVTLCVIYTLAALTIYPSIYPDAAGGFLVKKSMAAGGAWNHMTEPRPDDIAKDHSYFYAMWSPGQYVVPSGFEALGLTLGRAITAVCVAGGILGLAGWLLLFRTLGFEQSTVLATALLIAASRSFNLSFLTYVGSDLLAFAAFPWLAMVVHRLRRSWALVPAAPVLVLVGFFLKNSMAIYVSAWICAVVIVEAFCDHASARTRMRLAGAVVAVLLAAVFVQVFYLSRGWTPVSYQPVWPADRAAYVLPWAMPLLAATSVDDVLSRIFSRPGQQLFDYKSSIVVLLPIAVGSAAFVINELLTHSRQSSAVLIAVFAGGVVVTFAALHGTGSGASLELARHYLIPGFALLALLVRRVQLAPTPALRALMAIVIAAPCVYGVLSFGSNWRRHFEHRASHSDNLQVTYLMLTPRLVRFLESLDRELPGDNSLVVTPGHDYALEFSRTRVLATSVTSDAADKIAATKRYGEVDNVVVMAEQQGMTEAEMMAWLASFHSYNARRWEYLEADGFRFYVPIGQPVDRSWLAAEWNAHTDAPTHD